MPTSVFNQLNEIVELVVLTDPKSLLDVGVGFGKYGVLAREYLEFWDGREKYHEWTRRIDGIEAFREYLTPVHEYVYNHVYVGNALEIVPTLKEKYDLLLLIDIFEHFTCEEGKKFLADCLKVSKNVLISTPREMAKQEGAFGNPYETHKYQWTKKDFDQYDKKFFVPNDFSLIVYLGEDAQILHGKLMKRKMGNRLPWLRSMYRTMKHS
ncbi:MAG: class I SAM-dependent methyltransferase [Patescibacteria group bacterium]|jgi:hypothetical protein